MEDDGKVLVVVDEAEPPPQKPVVRITSEVECLDEGGRVSSVRTRIFVDGKDISCVVRDVAFQHSPDGIPTATIEILLPEMDVFTEHVRHFKIGEDQEDAILWLADRIVRRREADGGG